jgi:biotin-(acetyl-CoA carboxylase) ligase
LLPSLFRPVPLREGQDAMSVARALAPEAGPPALARGAGTLPYVRSITRAEAAVVLEPETSLAEARLAFHVGLNALADALTVLGPANMPVTFQWPGTVLLNGGRIGQFHLAMPEAAREDAVPDWLVIGFECRLAWREGHEGGLLPGETALEDEGFLDIAAEDVVEAWARHLLAGMDEWQARGPRRAVEKFLARLADHAEAPGVKRGLDPATGALILERDGMREVIAL